jgi:hypothetical protein
LLIALANAPQPLDGDRDENEGADKAALPECADPE